MKTTIIGATLATLSLVLFGVTIVDIIIVQQLLNITIPAAMIALYGMYHGSGMVENS